MQKNCQLWMCICCATCVCIIITLVLWPALYLNVLCNQNVKCFQICQGGFCLRRFISRIIQKVVIKFWIIFSEWWDVWLASAYYILLVIQISMQIREFYDFLRVFKEFLQHFWVVGCLSTNIQFWCWFVSTSMNFLIKIFSILTEFCAVWVLLINDVLVKL